MTIAINREVLHQAIDQLPESAFGELAQFIEFLQFKNQHPHSTAERWQSPDTDEMPSFKPVHFPESILILKDIDFSPEYIAQARKELWAGFGEQVT